MEFSMQIATRRLPRPLSLLACSSVSIFMLLHPDLALAQLAKVQSAAEKFHDWLWVLIPVAALIIAGALGLLYSAEVIRKDTLIQWGGGVIFAGALAGGIIKLFFLTWPPHPKRCGLNPRPLRPIRLQALRPINTRFSKARLAWPPSRVGSPPAPSSGWSF